MLICIIFDKTVTGKDLLAKKEIMILRKDTSCRSIGNYTASSKMKLIL